MLVFLVWSIFLRFLVSSYLHVVGFPVKFSLCIKKNHGNSLPFRPSLIRKSLLNNEQRTCHIINMYFFFSIGWSCHVLFFLFLHFIISQVLKTERLLLLATFGSALLLAQFLSGTLFLPELQERSWRPYCSLCICWPQCTRTQLRNK